MFRASVPLAFTRLVLLGSLSALASRPASASGGDLFVSSDGADTVRHYAGGTGVFQSNFTTSQAATGQLGIHFGPTNNRVLVGHFDGGVEEFDATTGAYIKTYNAAGGTQWAGLYGPNGNVLIGSWLTDDVREYNATTGALVQVLTTIEDPADMRIGPNGSLYICSFGGGFVSEVNAFSGVALSSWAQPPGSETNDIAFNPNGEILVTVMHHTPPLNRVYRYDSAYSLLGSFSGTGWNRTHGIVISPWTGNVLVVDGFTGQVHEFNPTTYAELDATYLTPSPGDKIVDLEFRPEPVCSIASGECCGGRPAFEDPAYASFGSKIAVGTASPQAVGSAVVAVFDLGNTPSSGPFNTDFGAPIYSHASWSQSNLGSVFGVALDSAGNIYVSSTTCYYSDVVGSLGNSGAVYKLDGTTSAATLFVSIPNTGPALGNICYDCEFDQFFVSSMDDGKIYRVSSAGVILDSFDFGAADVPSNVFAPLGDRVWAVQKHNGRLYFSLWWEDAGNPSATRSNEIWSVALDALGDFSGAARLELALPPLTGTNYSNPVSDMRFSALGTLLVAERGMADATLPTPHEARLLEFECDQGFWVPSAHTFSVGVGAGENSAGGVDIYPYSPSLVYGTGDALQFSPQTIYGIQGLPASGGSTANSILVDYNANLTVQDKTQIGDVAIPCGPPPSPMNPFCDPGYLGWLPCPCGNPPAGPARGCDNSSATGGASISATGVASLASDTLVFTTANEKPTATTILLQGTAQLPTGAVFGQGIRCVGGTLKRLYTRSAVGGSISVPSGADLSVSARSAALGDAFTTGATRYYMAYYRDPIVLGGCSPTSTFNTTAAGSVVWN